MILIVAILSFVNRLPETMAECVGERGWGGGGPF